MIEIIPLYFPIYQVAEAIRVGHSKTGTDIDPEASCGCERMVVAGGVILC